MRRIVKARKIDEGKGSECCFLNTVAGILIWINERVATIHIFHTPIIQISNDLILIEDTSPFTTHQYLLH